MGKSVEFAASPTGSGTLAAETATNALTGLAVKILLSGKHLKNVPSFSFRPLLTISGKANLRFGLRGRSNDGVLWCYIDETQNGNWDAPAELDARGFNDEDWFVYYANWVNAPAGNNAIGAWIYSLAGTELNGALFSNTNGGSLPTGAGTGAMTLHNTASVGGIGCLAIYSTALIGAARYAPPAVSDADLVTLVPFSEGGGVSAASLVAGRNAMTLVDSTWGPDDPWDAPSLPNRKRLGLVSSKRRIATGRRRNSFASMLGGTPITPSVLPPDYWTPRSPTVAFPDAVSPRVSFDL